MLVLVPCLTCADSLGMRCCPSALALKLRSTCTPAAPDCPIKRCATSCTPIRQGHCNHSRLAWGGRCAGSTRVLTSSPITACWRQIQAWWAAAAAGGSGASCGGTCRKWATCCRKWAAASWLRYWCSSRVRTCSVTSAGGHGGCRTVTNTTQKDEPPDPHPGAICLPMRARGSP